jgi:iron complex outermembrane receptor protein
VKRTAILVSWLVIFAPAAFAEEGRDGKAETPLPAAEPATAQRVPAHAIEEIVVTARKTEESLQDVPVAVTALSEEKLEQTSTFSPFDLQFQVPNMTAREGTGSSTAAVFQIRGQVMVDFIGTLDPSVGLYDDGIYVARPHGANLAFVDVRSIEVLRGPQGTLFGRNTTGGAILMNTHDPDLERVSGSVGGLFGSFRRRDFAGVLNVPLLRDTLGLRISAKKRSTAGYGVDETNHRDIATEGNDFLRAKLLFRPLEGLTFLANGEYLDMDQLGNPIKPVFALKLAQARNPITAGGIPCCLASLLIPNYDSFTDGDPYRANYDPGYLPRTRMRLDSLSLTGTWDTEWATLKLIGGIRRNREVSNRIDLDATPSLFVDTLQTSDNRQWSGELQLTGTWLGGHLKWAAGGYAFDERGHDNGHTTAFFPGVQLVTLGKIENASQGGYAQATYYLFEKLGVTGGVRYSADQKDLGLTSMLSSLCQIPQNLRDDRTNPLGACHGTFQKSFSNVSYTVGLDYHLFEDFSIFDSVLVYASRTTGYRAGGQNLRGASAETLQPFDAETVLQHEVGIKSNLFDHRVRLNVAGFFTSYDDIQRDAIIAVNGAPATVISNAAKAKVNGAELELTALPPIDGLELGASLGIIKPHYDKFVDASGDDRSHEKFDDVPEMTYGLSAGYTRDVLDIPWLNRVDWAWQDDVPFTRGTSNYFRSQGVDIEPLVTMPAGGVLNVRSALTFASGVELGFFARNLTNKLRFASIPIGQGPDFISRLVNAPGREFGGEVRYRF